MPRSADVDAWFAAHDHPLADAMTIARRLIPEADDRGTGSVKWQTPTFAYRGDIVSVHRAKTVVSLLLHRGAPGRHPRLVCRPVVNRYARQVSGRSPL